MRTINRNQKLTIVFILLASSFIGIEFALRPLLSYALIIGWGLGILCQILALVFAIKWNWDKKVN